jgi:RNA polymerase sigma-70 factor (ECF subfamily)
MDRSSKKPFVENAGLMRKAADGDIEAFKRLYQRYAPLMNQFFIIRGAGLNSAEDFIQKIFVHLWRQRKNYRPESSFETYLFSIARHILYKEIRQSRKINEIISKKQTASDEGKYNTLSQPEAECYLEELSEALEAAKTKLTDEQLYALEIAQEPDIDLQKALEELGWSKEAYKKRLKRTRDRIIEILNPILDDEKPRSNKKINP